MKTNQPIRQHVMQAFSFALYFALLAITYRVWQTDSIAWKAILSVASAICLMWFIRKGQFIELCGFIMLMVGINLLWQCETIAVFWKVLGSVAVTLQFGNLGKVTIQVNEK